MKNILGVYGNPNQHWVGNGFPVRSLFSYNDLGKQISPFILLDYAGPYDFSPSKSLRGVGQHPHRGFETVTIVYKGEVAHRDSTGSGGLIGPGDVQWMTAASGILHEEFHSTNFASEGGTLEMVQLWVNLPARDKSAPPRYQTLLNQDIPEVPLTDDAGHLRVIAGEYSGHRGPALTFTPMDVWDLRVKAGKSVSLNFTEGRTTALVVLSGTVMVNGSELVRDAQMVLFDRSGEQVLLETNNDAMILVLSGEPIDEPIVGYGPFVMNTEEEITQAMEEFQAGKFGQIPAA